MSVIEVAEVRASIHMVARISVAIGANISPMVAVVRVAATQTVTAVTEAGLGFELGLLYYLQSQPLCRLLSLAEMAELPLP